MRGNLHWGTEVVDRSQKSDSFRSLSLDPEDLLSDTAGSCNSLVGNLRRRLHHIGGTMREWLA